MASRSSWRKPASRQLAKERLQVFNCSTSLRTDGSWSEESEHALDYSANLLVCFGHSSGSPSRDRLLEKARRAVRIRIVPVLLPGSDESALRSFGLDTVQRIDLRQDPNGEQLTELVKDLKRPSPPAPREVVGYPG